MGRLADSRPLPGSGSSSEMLARLLAAAALLGGLYVLQLNNYLAFHSIAETFSVAVAAAVFMLAWNARHFTRNGFFLWIGTGYFAVAIIDLVHTLAYKGMGVFPDGGANHATQLWVAARSLQALVLVTAPIFLRRNFRPGPVFAGFAAVVALLLVSIFGWHVFPVAYDDVAGHLTLFKIVAEYVICGLLVASLILLWRARERFDAGVLWLITASVVATLLSELCFTLYISVYGTANLLGHYLKIVAFYFIYKAVVETGLRRPYELLFRDLTQREEDLEQSRAELQELNETLEQRVARRTEELRTLARELDQVEQRERLRVAEVLHEDVQQALAACRLRLGLAGQNADAALSRELREASDLLLEAIETCRRLSSEVSPAIVHDHGLAAGLEWLAEHMETRHGLVVRLDLEPGVHCGDAERDELLLRCVRELLFNVVKHSGVDRATITLCATDDGGLVLTVSDAGAGFDPAALSREGRRHGFGMNAVAGRLTLLGGRCSFSSAPGRGTRTTMIVPGEGGAGQ